MTRRVARKIQGRTLMEHERHRWSYMDMGKMRQRLNKITTLDKLDCFILVAREEGEMTLAGEAAFKRRILDPFTGTSSQARSVFGKIDFEF